MNTDSVLQEVLRLTNYKKNRVARTCPSMLDKYASYNDAFLAVNNPLASFLDATEAAEVPNGAWYDLIFTKPDGSALGAGPGYYLSGSLAVGFVNGIPVRTGTAGLPVVPPVEGAYVVDGVQAYPLFIRFRSAEKLVLSPFIFADSAEWETGLWACNNIQIVANFRSSVARVIRSTTAGGRTLSAVGFNTSVPSPFNDAKLNVQYLTPSLDVPLPPKSSIPYLEFPRYVTTATATSVDAGGKFDVRSQTIVLPQIPDSLVIAVKPQAYAATDGDWYYPIQKITVNFDKEALSNCFAVAVAA
jgi:hypothetical protein